MVTGGAGGIGGAVVRRLLGDGAAVAVLDREEQRGRGLVAELAASGGSVRCVASGHYIQAHSVPVLIV